VLEESVYAFSPPPGGRYNAAHDVRTLKKCTGKFGATPHPALATLSPREKDVITIFIVNSIPPPWRPSQNSGFQA